MEKILSQTKIERRQAMEKEIVSIAIDSLIEAGYELSLNNGGEQNEIDWTIDRQAVLKAMFEVDEEHLLARLVSSPSKIRWIHLVYGNDGFDVICDYSSKLGSVLMKANARADELEKLS